MSSVLADIVLENFLQVMVFPLGSSLTFEALYWFGKAGVVEGIMVILGMSLGAMVSWGLGQVLALLRKQRPQFFPQKRFDSIGVYVRRYGVFLLPFYWLPLGGLVLVVAGFFGLRWWLVLLLAVLGAALRLAVYFPALLQ